MTAAAAARSADHGSKLVLYAGLAANVLVAITKFVAGGVTGSSAMLSEGVHSLVDSSNELLLLYGAHRATAPPDREHPFGHGREVYFWSFVVSLMMFALGAGVSVYEGVHHFRDAEPIENPLVNYVVLAVAGVFEVGSWWVSLREFRHRKGDRGYLQAAEETKDPAILIVLFENTADLIGIALAAAGIAASSLLEDGRWDALASIAIGVLLGGIAAFLARETKKLLIGEAARPSVVESVARLARSEPGVGCYNGMLSIQLAPREVIVAISLDFEDRLRASEVQGIVARLETRIRKEHPEIVMVLVKPQSPDLYRKARERWMNGP